MIHYFSEKASHKHVEDYIEQKTEFQFIERLGRGSYGVAYLIQQPDTKRKYVLKRMLTKHQRKKKLRQKFQQEIKILQELKIPYIPSVYTQGTVQGTPFFIMDYIEGYTFEQAIFKEGQIFSVSESLQITKQLLELVIPIHRKGIVHRDLRIPNILINEDALYIIDFGLATYIETDIHFEKIDNPKKVANHISDLYFVGHFLLFLLYSNFTPSSKKERSWQEELQLSLEVVEYIERLLFIREPFTSAEDALQSLLTILKKSSTT